jgi:hypothetical protein
MLLGAPRGKLVRSPATAALGTTWGPHVMHTTEPHVGCGTSCTTFGAAVTCGNAYLNVLGVKGSWVQIPPARPKEIPGRAVRARCRLHEVVKASQPGSL